MEKGSSGSPRKQGWRGEGAVFPTAEGHPQPCAGSLSPGAAAGVALVPLVPPGSGSELCWAALGALLHFWQTLQGWQRGSQRGHSEVLSSIPHLLVLSSASQTAGFLLPSTLGPWAVEVQDPACEIRAGSS